MSEATALPIEPQPLPQDLVTKFPFKVGTRLSDWLDQGRLKQYFKNRFVCFSMVDAVINIFFLFHRSFNSFFKIVFLRQIKTNFRQQNFSTSVLIRFQRDENSPIFFSRYIFLETRLTQKTFDCVQIKWSDLKAA